MLIVLVLMTSAGIWAAPVPQDAAAYSVNTALWSGTTASPSSVSLPTGVTVTSTVSGLTSHDGSMPDLNANNPPASVFTPSIPLTTPSKRYQVLNSGCTFATGTCAARGTITLTFSQPVTNPVLHFTGLGSRYFSGSLAATMGFSALLTLSGSTPAGIAWGTPSAGSTNLAVSGTTLTRSSPGGIPSTDCQSLSTEANEVAGCGSVPLVGTVSSVTLNLSLLKVWISGNANAVSASATAGDSFELAVSVSEDFGDAPATYNSPQAPVHAVGSPILGVLVDADHPTVPNAAASPFPGVPANGDNITLLNDEDAFVTAADVALSTGTHTVAVPISRVTKAARLCGWIDFNQDGTFAVVERACVNVAIAATTASLTWSVPPGSTPGNTYVRLRIGYTAAQVESPTGRADSGEVEDYPITLAGAAYSCAALYATHANPNLGLYSINPATGGETQVGQFPGTSNALGMAREEQRPTPWQPRLQPP